MEETSLGSLDQFLWWLLEAARVKAKAPINSQPFVRLEIAHVANQVLMWMLYSDWNNIGTYAWSLEWPDSLFQILQHNLDNDNWVEVYSATSTTILEEWFTHFTQQKGVQCTVYTWRVE
jgi:hypothetical protein